MFSFSFGNKRNSVGAPNTGSAFVVPQDGLLDGDKRWSCQFTPASTSDSDPSYYQCHVSYYLTEPQEIYGIRVGEMQGCRSRRS